MKTTFKNLICSASIIGLILSASTVLAQPYGRDKRDPEVMKERREAHMQRIQEQLNLNEEQQELLEAHKAKHREAMKVFHEAIKTKRGELKTELEKQELDMDQIRKLHSEMKELDAKMADHRLEGILEVREILTPEQFTEFMKLTGKHKRGRGMRHGPLGPPAD